MLLLPPGSLSTFILPASMYLKLMPSDARLYRSAQGLLLFGVFVMVAVIVETIIAVI